MPPDDDKNKDKNKPDPNALDLSKNPQFAQLMTLVTALGKGQQQLTAALTTQGANFEKLSKTLAGNKGDGGKPPAKETTDEDVNGMSQAELAGHIFKGVRGLMDGMKTELTKNIGDLTTSFTKKNLETEVEQVRKAHKDFDEWIPEVKEKMNANPGLSINEAYTLVRAANPEKSKEMDNKFKVGLDGEVSKNKETFGGLLPTSRISSTDDGNNDTKLTKPQAQDKAWEEVFGDNPALAGPDSED